MGRCTQGDVISRVSTAASGILLSSQINQYPYRADRQSEESHWLEEKQMICRLGVSRRLLAPDMLHAAYSGMRTSSTQAIECANVCWRALGQNSLWRRHCTPTKLRLGNGACA